MIDVDEKYMRRALQLARRGMGFTSPNPMVGAVIVDPQGNIVGEGYHRICGEAHAEVNAVNSVACKDRLPECTIYVTLEPCSHYGKTPPCAKLLIDCGIKRVVIGSVDPFREVSGRGIEMLRQSGAEVVTGVLDQECRSLNARFFTAHTMRRPFIALKFARTADGWLDIKRPPSSQALKISTPLTSVLAHRFRSLFDAILVGSGTVLADSPRLDTRLWDGRSPRPVILDRRGRVSQQFLDTMSNRNPLLITRYTDLPALMSTLYSEHAITSVLVEGGAEILQSFVNQNLWDIIREEVSPITIGSEGTAKAPQFNANLVGENHFEPNTIKFYSQNPLFHVKNL